MEKYFITPHAYEQFIRRFSRALVRFNKAPLDFFMESVQINVAGENRDWIDYHYNVTINAVFVSDRVTKTIITSFIPKDEIKYKEAIFLHRTG